MFNVILTLIGLHVAAILFYLLVKRDNLVIAMLTGRRRNVRMMAMTTVPAWRIIPGIVLARAWSGGSPTEPDQLNRK